MTILHVIASMEAKTGGVAQAVRSMIQGHGGGEIVHEVVCLDSAHSGGELTDSFPLHALGPHFTPWCYSPQLLPWLSKHLPRFDAVIIHGLWLYPSHAVRKALDRIRQKGARGPRCHVMPHGMLDPYFQRDRTRRIKALRNWLMWKVVESKVVNGAESLLFTCEEEKQLAHQSFRPYRPQCESVVGLGVEAPPPPTTAMKTAFHAACPGLGSRPYRLFLARLHPKKGVDLLIRAYLESWQQACRGSDGGKDFPALVIAGPLDDAYAREMQKLAAAPVACSHDALTVTSSAAAVPDDHAPALSLSPNAPVFFTGMLVGDAKWGAFHGCEAFVLPSHQENFGIAVVEALACGKPVLISDKVNIWREILADGAALVAPDTLEGTRSLMERWLALPEVEKVKMGENARRCFEQRFDIAAAAERLGEILKS